MSQAPQYAAQSDVDVEDADRIAVGFVLDLESDIGDPHHFATLPVDDLLIEQIADQTQHVFVGMIGRKLFVFEVDPIERNGADLIVTNGEPRPAAAHEKPVYAGGMDEGNNGGVFDQAQAAALQVIDLEAQKFGEKEEVVRHRESPEPITIDPWSARSSRLKRFSIGCALHGRSVLLWPKRSGCRNKKGEKITGGVPVVTFGPGSADRTGGGGGQGDAGSRVCPAVEKHIFDVAGRIEVFFVLGDAF